MEILNKKCSFKKHLENDAINYCIECKIYLCNKCNNYHSELFENHHLVNLDKNLNDDIFTGYCQEKEHNIVFKYFCKNHNKLCCAACISKINSEGDGQHSDCDICIIKDIIDDKKIKLNDNIKTLEELFKKLEQSINQLKTLFQNIIENKEALKLKIQKIFTQIRNILNEREDKLLLEVDNQYNNKYFNEKIIKESEKLPNKIKLSLEKGKKINKEWNEKDKINLYLNDCINIENNIEEINFINEKIEKCNSNNDIKISFIPEENREIENFLEIIKTFGKIIDKKENKLFESKINFDEKLIELWLNNKKFISKLLFRKSENGSTSNDFHRYCDNKGTTISFIETTKGYIFGGYTELDWEKEFANKRDGKTFIFSLDNKEKYHSKNNNDEIICFSSCALWFGNAKNPDIIIRGSLDEGECYDELDNTFISGRKLTKGEQYFKVKEIEVYQINYI